MFFQAMTLKMRALEMVSLFNVSMWTVWFNWPAFLKMYIWVVVSKIFYFHPYLGKILILTNIFQMGWNHQPDIVYLIFCTMLSYLEDRLDINQLHPRLFGWSTLHPLHGEPKACMYCTEVDTTSPNFLKDLSSALKARNVGILLANTIMQLGTSILCGLQ